ncbi:uncharacterized protein [Choristoneura fumiferana]|uniref:uncharacterized protein n=1 Tax=Choristoneura fumiferana TaxID=7141 RepID=UPI003D15C3CB
MTAEFPSKNMQVVLTLFILTTITYTSSDPVASKHNFRTLSNDSLNLVKESAIDSDYIVTVLNLLSKLYQEAEIRPKTKRRQLNRRPSVELGPGTIKSPILKYPEKYFEKKLKHLIKLQKQQEERNKDLNSLCWFLIQVFKGFSAITRW